MKFLVGLINLQQLYLVNTKITDDGMKFLVGLTNLQQIYLWGTFVTDVGKQALVRSIKQLKIE